MSKNTLTLHSEDIGNCRVYVKNSNSLYCFQEEETGSPPLLYVCTEEGEPEHLVLVPEGTTLNLQAGGYLFNEITTAFYSGSYFIKPTVASYKRSELETDFVYVSAEIIWVGQSQPPETVIISNTSHYPDLAACDFCGKCENCRHDNSIHYYVDNLTELDELMKKSHDDGWMIKSYSVIDTTKDLFEFYELQPTALEKVCSKYDDTSLTYKECEEFLKQVEKHGYTFEYGLDGVPYDLRLKISN